MLIVRFDSLFNVIFPVFYALIISKSQQQHDKSISINLTTSFDGFEYYVPRLFQFVTLGQTRAKTHNCFFPIRSQLTPV